MSSAPRPRLTRRVAVRRALVTVAAAAASTLVASGCSVQQPSVDGPRVITAEPVSARSWSTPAPGPLKHRLLSPDLLVWTSSPLTEREVRRLQRTGGVRASTTVAVASVPVQGRTLLVAGVDPGAFRRFTDPITARSDALWQRVAAGDVALTEDSANAIHADLGAPLVVQSEQLPVGAFATSIPMVDAVMNKQRAAQLGLSVNGLVIAVHGPVDAAGRRITRRLPGARFVRLDTAAQAAAFSGRLAGGSLGDAIGSFTYRWFPDGTVAPDPAWVAANIRTESVPILGRMTCHRAIFPQLRAALREIVRSGLASKIHPSEYAGCYVPRFIASDPTKGLSLHTFGIAFDLNVPGNQRGTAGEIDRRVVDIFKRWGFAWGGDWSYTDPMHFELAALVRP